MVVSDSRVSYGDESYEQNFALQKLMYLPYEFKNRFVPIVLGFSGYVDCAYKIVQFLFTEKHLLEYKRSLVIAQFAGDICKWLRDAIQEQPIEQLLSTTFLLSAQEYMRPSKVYDQQGNMSGYLPFFEGHIYTFSFTRQRDVICQRHSNFAAIGSGKEEAAFLDAMSQHFINSGRGFPEADFMRSMMVYSDTGERFRNTQPQKIGGPYQIMRINPKFGLHISFFWSRAWMPLDTLQLTFDASDVVVTNVSSGESCTLLTLDTWHGKFGSAAFTA